MSRRNADIATREFSRLLAGLVRKDWDAVVPTAECRHCYGTGIAPGDGNTECGFCE